MEGTSQPQHFSSLLNSRTMVVVFATSIFMSYLFLRSYEDTSGFVVLYLLMAVQTVPLVLCLTLKKINYISLILFNHFVTFSVAKYNAVSVLKGRQSIPPDTFHGIQELLYCSLLLMVGYFCGRLIFFYRFNLSRSFYNLKLSKWQLIIVGSYVLFQGIIVNYLPPTLRTIHFVTSCAALVLLLCSSAPGYEILSVAFKIGSVLSVGQYFINSGSLSQFGSLGSILFIVAVVQGKTRNLLIVVFIGLMMSVIQPVKGKYREIIQENLSISYVERIILIGELMHWKYIEGGGDDPARMEREEEYVDNEGVEKEVLKGFARIGDDSLERVLAMTPSSVPFWGGETYGILPYMFIPRFLWPEKPTHRIWNKFGRTYGFLSSDDYSTSVGVSYLGEAYMNFGYVGMYTCALFFGFFVVLVERLSYFFIPGSYYFTFICFLIPLMTYAGDLSSIINSIVLMTSVLLVFRLQFQNMAMSDDYS